MAAEHAQSLELSTKGKRKGKRNGIFFLVLIAFIVLSFSIGWYILTHKVQDSITAQINAFNQQGYDIFCENMHKAGFPLRVGIACDSFQFKYDEQEIAVTGQKFQAKTPIYAPKTLELQVESPFDLQLSSLNPILAKWSSLNLEIDTSTMIPDFIHMQTKDFVITSKAIEDAGNANRIETHSITPMGSLTNINKVLEDTTISAGFLNIEAKDLDQNLTAKITFSDLKLPYIIPNELTALPAMEGKITFSLENSADIFVSQNTNLNIKSLRGHKGVITNSHLKLQTGGQLLVSGPFSFDKDGYLDAEFTIAVADQVESLQTASALFPSQAKNIKMIFFGLNSLPKDNAGNPQITLRINKGEMRISFFKFGQIQPI